MGEALKANASFKGHSHNSCGGFNVLKPSHTLNVLDHLVYTAEVFQGLPHSIVRHIMRDPVHFKTKFRLVWDNNVAVFLFYEKFMGSDELPFGFCCVQRDKQ